MKKHIRLLLFLVFVNFYTYSQHKQHLNQTKISEDLYYSQISDSVIMFTHYFPFWGGNSMVVLLPDNKGVLIDTPYENSGTKALLRWLSDNFGDLDLTAIVTGFHQDNLGGNEVLISKGIPVYGADLTKQLVEEEGDEFKKLIVESVRGNENKRYVEAYTDLNFTPPSITFPIKEGLKLEIGNEVFEVYFPGESHTIDNTVVYMYNRKILFGGCMLKGLMYKNPGYMGYANMAEWPKSVKKVINKYPECKIVVPGHGDFGDKEILFHTLNILEDWNSKNPQIK